RKVTGRPAGTSIGFGVNEKVSARTETSTPPSGVSVTLGSPNSRLLPSVVGSMVSTWLGGWAAWSTEVATIVPRNRTTSPAAARSQIRSWRSTCMAASAGRGAPEEAEVHGDPAQRQEQPVEDDDGQRAARMSQRRGVGLLPVGRIRSGGREGHGRLQSS